MPQRLVFLLTIVCLFFSSLVTIASASEPKSNASSDVSFLLEAEDFQFPGGWVVLGDATALSRKYLMPDGSDKTPPDALTAITLPRSGVYHLWARTRDYKTYLPGVRRFKLAIDGQPLEKELGAHGVEGFAWEPAGTLEMSAGDHMLGLRFTKSIYARCDAVLLTTTDMEPGKLSARQIAALRVRPSRVAVEESNQSLGLPELVTKSPGPPLATLDNGKLRLEFTVSQDDNGSPVVTRQMAVRTGNSWTAVSSEPSIEWMFALCDENPTVKFYEGKPRWECHGAAQVVEVGGRSYEVQLGANDPFSAGQMTALIACTAKQIDGQTVEIRYASDSHLEAVGRWTLEPDRYDVGIAITMEPPKEADYSLGYCGFGGFNREQVDFVQLPPLYQFQRLPDQPLMVTSSFTPHPLALVQVGGDQKNPLSLAVVGEPTRLPMRWPTARNPIYGFSLLGPTLAVQPSVFSPVLGLEGSHWTPGEKYQVAWRLLAYPGTWKRALEYASRQIMEVCDYRQPVNVSLTDAALNMIELMRRTDPSGWDAQLKGFYNIEMESTVTHAAPLAILEAALLSHDEKLFVERALPTIEYTLTRPGAHTGRPSLPEKGLRRLSVPNRFFGTSYWQGLDLLLGRLNPWLREFALPDGKPYHARGYNASPGWSELLAAYRYEPDDTLLDEIRRQADDFIDRQIHGTRREPVSFQAFYNISFYPYWWDLVDLYELTGEKRYLDAAEEGAFHTVAGLWSHPQFRDGSITVHPDGQYEGTATIWWKDGERYRLGYPRKPNDTPAHDVPAWQVSQIGLGLEQPSTFFTSNKGQRHILMSAWAPHLLRVFQYSQRDIFRTYARNSLIGRFANYNGYYLMGYTDVVNDPLYPYRGPDVTSLYYHHVPPQLAFTLDYLVSQAWSRSGGRIQFPWAKQQNYAWFTNRVYSTLPGEIYGEAGASLWLDGEAVRIPSAEVDWLAARSADRFWLILMSQGAQPLTVSPQLDAARIGLKESPFLRYEGDQAKAVEQPAGSYRTVTVPAKGIVVLSIPADLRKDTSRLSPLGEGHVVCRLDEDWGELHGFRIRTPFGKDALYVAITGGLKKDAVVTLRVGDGSSPRVLEARTFPYEFSVYPWAPGKTAELTVEILEATGSKRTERLSLPGTP